MKKRGFTLIELIVVMAIISILVLLGVPKYKEYTNQARITKLTVEAKELEKASQKYYMTYNDWPRLNDEAYTAEQLKSYAEDIFDKTGKVVVLDVNGDYYNISYAKLSNYINEPKGSERYILQNPVGIVYYLDNLTEIGKQVIKPIEIILDNPNSIFITEVPLGSTVELAGMNWIMINSTNSKLLLAANDGNRAWDSGNSNDYATSDIRAYLNNESTGFLSKIPVKYQDYIANATWYCGNEKNEGAKTVQDKIGLLRESEHNSLRGNILPAVGDGFNWWTMTTLYGFTDRSRVVIMNYVTNYPPVNSSGVRPALHLKPEVKVTLNSENVYVVE